MLSPQQEAFVSNYLVSSNAAASAIAAGYSSATAKEQASRLLKHPIIKQRIEEFASQMQKKTEITVERLVQELAKIAFVEIGQAVDVENDQVRIKSLGDIPVDVRSAISEISEVDTKFGTRRTIKLLNKISAIDLLLKTLGAYVTVGDIIDKLDDQMIDQITVKLLEKAKNNKPSNNKNDEEEPQ